MKFTEIDFHPNILADIEKNNFVECTPVQELAIPHIIEGRDISGLAQTGTGKTAAFLLPLMNRIAWGKELNGDGTSSLKPEKTKIFKDWKETNYILVLVPTRELAEQVFDNVKSFGETSGFKAVSIYGGTSYETQKSALNRGVQFIVATPGRLIDLYKENFVDLGQVRAIVFDEADRMFDMGFKDDMKYILKRIPQDRQFLVFSATLNFDVLNTAYEFGADPVEVNVSKDQAKAENVKDELFHVGSEEKAQYLLSLIKKYQPGQAIVFSNFKRNVERIAQFLTDNGYHAMGISSLLSQKQRNRVMEQFKADNDRNILVATDVAARGLDIKGVDLVINYELPDDPENYVHRIGRTGRAQEQGLASSLVGDRDIDALARIENYLGHRVEMGWLEDSDLVQEFKSFPRDRDRDRKPRRDDSRKAKYNSNDGKPSHKKSKDRRKGNKYGTGEEARGRSGEGSQKRSEESSSHRDRKTGRHKNHSPRPDSGSPHKGKEGRKKRRQNVNPNQRKRGAGRRRHQKTEDQAAVPPVQATGMANRLARFIKRIFN